MPYLLDTCVISKLRKLEHQPNPPLETWVRLHPETQYYLSILTIGEIEAGIQALKSDNGQKRVLSDWLLNSLTPRFEGRVIDIDREVAVVWGNLQAKLRSEGRPMPSIDSLIAATAIAKQLTLVTYNIKDFENSGVKLLEPTLERV